MTVTIYESIGSSLAALLQQRWPAFRLLPEAPGTGGDSSGPPAGDWFFLELLPAGNRTVDPGHTDRRILVDAAIHTREESGSSYLRIAQEADSLLRPVVRFEDGGEKRAVTVPDLSFKVEDRVLHCSFTLAFRDSIQEPEAPPLMEELETAIKSNERA